MSIENPNRDLNTWKEIAGYLGVSIRTAQFWEKSHGLPVKRYPGPRGRVAAQAEELKRWKETVRASGNGGGAVAPAPMVPDAKRRPTWRWMSVIVITAALLGASAATIAGARVDASDLRVVNQRLIVLDGKGSEVWGRRMGSAPIWSGLIDRVPAPLRGLAGGVLATYLQSELPLQLQFSPSGAGVADGANPGLPAIMMQPGPGHAALDSVRSVENNGPSVIAAIRLNGRTFGGLLFPGDLQEDGSDVVYGQSGSFSSVASNKGGISAESLSTPYGVALDDSGSLYISDYNHRVLRYRAGSTKADRVYGQHGDFTTGVANKGGISAHGLNKPSWVAVARDGVYVSDSGNHRVLYYPGASKTAVRVYGQSGSFTSNTPNKGGVSANSLSIPNGLAVDPDGGLYVADHGNNRVLHFPAGSTTADRVYGQGGKSTTCARPKEGAGPERLHGPSGVAIDAWGGLYVSSTWDHRVYHYPRGSTTPDRVYGLEGDLPAPFGVGVDRSGGLYVADYSNGIVAHYPMNSVKRDRYYGQWYNPSAASVYTPYGIAVDRSEGFYTAQILNNRVTHFAGPPPASAPAASLAEGSYQGPRTVSLSARTPDSRIYYTLDGSEPTVASLPSKGPIPVTASRTIRAVATAPGHSMSAVSTFRYRIQSR